RANPAREARPGMSAPASTLERDRTRVLTGTSAGLGVLFAAALVCGANYLAARHYRRFDWTHGGVYTLSGKTLRVLRNLRQDVHLLAFGSQSDPQNDDLRETILRYDGVSPHVHAEWIDPD